MNNGNRSPRWTMTADEIKLAFLLNRQRGRKPRSQYQLAQMFAVPRSMMSVAVSTPDRYPGLRRRIERRLRRVVAPERKSA